MVKAHLKIQVRRKGRVLERYCRHFSQRAEQNRTRTERNLFEMQQTKIKIETNNAILMFYYFTYNFGCVLTKQVQDRPKYIHYILFKYTDDIVIDILGDRILYRQFNTILGKNEISYSTLLGFS